MRWRPGEGIALLDLHLERLAASAEYFGFQAKAEDKDKDEDKEASIEGSVRAAVASRCAGLASRSYRVRLRLARGGGLAIAVDPFEPSRSAWRVAVAGPQDPSMEAVASVSASALASAPVVASESVFAFHKTTLRAPYEAALAAAPPGVDEVLLVNEWGELTEGTRTNVALQFGGGWVTPPLEAGLLPGVFREHLVRSGRLVEATLYPRDLRRAHRVRLMNALRGWIAVELVGFGRRSGG
jgi:para-aminobenzoate synthetase/4-amino-4-deoxychorismate lyase